MVDKSIIKELSKQLFVLWSMFFFLVVLPLDFIIRIDSFLVNLNPMEIAATTAVVALYFIALSALVCMLCDVAAFFLHRMTRGLLWSNIVAISVLTAYKFVSAGWIWLQNMISCMPPVTGIITKALLALPLSIFFITYVYFNQTELTIRHRKISPPFLRFVVLPIAIVSIIIIIVQVVLISKEESLARKEHPLTAHSVIGSNPLNILIITCDALSAEDMSVYSYSLPTTPRMMEFAETSTVFLQMYANSTSTSPSCTSILTSKYPLYSKVYTWKNHVQESIERENIVHELKKHGYTTAAIGTSFHAHPYQLRLEKGFDHLPLPDSKFASRHVIINEIIVSLSRYHIDGEWITDRLKFFLVIWKQLKCILFNGCVDDEITPDYPARETLLKAENFIANANCPWFLWVHVWSPHNPYLAGSHRYALLSERVLDTHSSQYPYGNRFFPSEEQIIIDKLRLRYDEMIMELDHDLGYFFDKLKEQGHMNDTIIMLTADHGEIFEKGYQGHGSSGCIYLYQPLIHIPFIIRIPDQETGRRVECLAEHIDIAPTLLDLVGYPKLSWMNGESLKNQIFGAPQSGNPKFAMDLENCSPQKKLSDGSIAVINNGFKYIYYLNSKKGEIYDLARDPGEMLDLSVQRRDVAEAMQNIIFNKFGEFILQ